MTNHGPIGPLDVEPKGNLHVIFDLSKFGAGQLRRHIKVRPRSRAWSPFPFLASHFHRNYATEPLSPSRHYNRIYRNWLRVNDNRPTRPEMFNSFRYNTPVKKYWNGNPNEWAGKLREQYDQNDVSHWRGWDETKEPELHYKFTAEEERIVEGHEKNRKK